MRKTVCRKHLKQFIKVKIINNTVVFDQRQFGYPDWLLVDREEGCSPTHNAPEHPTQQIVSGPKVQ